MANKTDTDVQLWELPDVILFNITCFCAAPTHRASILCHQIAPLCKSSHRTLLLDERAANLWDMLLKEDYGVTTDNRLSETKKRRACKRLRRSPAQKVRDAHRLINDNTEIAFYYLNEMVNSSSKAGKLTKAKMISLFDEYGPHLRINRPVSSGGLYLVEICRAKHVTETVILKCVQELIENRGALVDAKSMESINSSENALCVAAARGMHTVVRYLLEQAGANKDIVSSGRFALHSAKKKTIRCIDKKPLEFACAMQKAEKAAGASDSSLFGLNKCIYFLKR
jgi:hypothetical protein